MTACKGSLLAMTLANNPSRQERRTRTSLLAVFLSTILLLGHLTQTALATNPDYSDALNKLILFFEGQRSGKLDLSTLRNTWRSHSALQDGAAQNVREIGKKKLLHTRVASLQQCKSLSNDCGGRFKSS